MPHRRRRSARRADARAEQRRDRSRRRDLAEAAADADLIVLAAPVRAEPAAAEGGGIRMRGPAHGHHRRRRHEARHRRGGRDAAAARRVRRRPSDRRRRAWRVRLRAAGSVRRTAVDLHAGLRRVRRRRRGPAVSPGARAGAEPTTIDAARHDSLMAYRQSPAATDGDRIDARGRAGRVGGAAFSCPVAGCSTRRAWPRVRRTSGATSARRMPISSDEALDRADRRAYARCARISRSPETHR